MDSIKSNKADIDFFNDENTSNFIDPYLVESEQIHKRKPLHDPNPCTHNNRRRL